MLQCVKLQRYIYYMEFTPQTCHTWLVVCDGIENALGSQHATLHGVMRSLDLGHVHQAGTAADQSTAGKDHLGQRLWSVTRGNTQEWILKHSIHSLDPVVAKGYPNSTVQPLPEVKFWRTFFIVSSSSNGLIFDTWEEKGLKFDLALKETKFFRLCAQQRREKNHIEREREKWRHKSFWRKKHGFSADMDVDIPIVHGATPRREWQVANFLRCEQLNRHRIAWAWHKSIATASDFKEGG